MTYINIFLVLLIITDIVKSLMLLELNVPASILLGARAQLSCRWHLGPTDVLYSVKWYKDGKEFFRYVPNDGDPLRKFLLPGVEVSESNAFGGNLTLAPASLQSSGRYRCEVSGEKPFFPTVSKHADMQIMVLPDKGPVISGLSPRYKVGDKLLVNCTSGRSRPPTNLTWYINGELVYSDHLINYLDFEAGLTVSISTLDLEVKDSFFKGNRFNIKCLATLHPIYWKSKEESIVKEFGIIIKISDFTNTHASFKSGRSRQKNNTAFLYVNTSFLLFCTLCFLAINT